MAVKVLKVPLTCSEKSGNWDLLLSYCRYFDKHFAEMFPESSTKHIILDQTSQFDWLPWHGNQNVKFAKKYLKIQLLRSYKGESWHFAELFIILASAKKFVFIAVAQVLWLLWQL